MTDNTVDEKGLRRITRFFSKKISRYIFLVVDDEGHLKKLVSQTRERLQEQNINIPELSLNTGTDTVFRQVSNFMEEKKDGGPIDGLLITGLNALINKQGIVCIEQLNRARDAFERFGIPFVITVSNANIGKVINNAPDFYQMRALPDIRIEEKVSKPGPEEGFTPENISLLEEQLHKESKKKKIGKDVLNQVVTPLLRAYLETGDIQKAKELYETYIKENQDQIVDRNVLEDYLIRVWHTVDYNPDTIPETVDIAEQADNDVAPVVTDGMFADLTPNQRRLLEVLSIYRKPVPRATFETHNVTMNDEDRAKLESLSLLESEKEESRELFYINSSTGKYLQDRMTEENHKQLHIEAAEHYYTLRDKERRIDVRDHLEARWHFIQTDEWNRAADVTYDLEDYLSLRGSTHLAMELLQELPLEKLSEENQGIAHNRLGILHQHFGDYDSALEQYQQSLAIKEKIGDTKGIAISLHQVGMIYELKGDYDSALEQYQQSLAIAEKIGDTKGIAQSLHQVGMIYELKGDYDSALEQYQQSLAIKEKIGDTKGIAISLHQVGMIYQEKGDYDSALEQYQQSLAIAEKIGDTKGIAQSLHQVGNIYYLKGDYDSALEQYQQSLAIAEKIGDTKGIAQSLHQVGRIYQEKGDYDSALEQYQQSLAIAEKIGDTAGVAISTGQMGQLHFKKGEYESALRCGIRAFLICGQIGSPNVRLAIDDIGRAREKFPPEQFEAVLQELGVPADTFDKEGAD